MSELRELYQSVILDHNRAPRNYGPLDRATAHAQGRNPLCGDDVTVWIQVTDGRVGAIQFVGTGCAISKASASLMTTVIKGQTTRDALALVERFQAVVTGAPGHVPDIAEDGALRRLAPLAGVSRFPERVKCATLAWHALRAAMGQAAAGGPESSGGRGQSADRSPS